MRNYFYKLLSKYLNYYILKDNSVIEVNPRNDILLAKINSEKKLSIDFKEKKDNHNIEIPDYYILNGNLHFEKDIQHFLEEIKKYCKHHTRLIVCYYSSLWYPIIKLASFFKIVSNNEGKNWFSPSDLRNFSILADYEIISEQQRILLPFNIPGFSYFLNRWIAPLPFFRLFTLLNIAILRPILDNKRYNTKPSVSVVVAARNEEGNIENIVNRIPVLGPNDELIIIEGNSTDNTWDEMVRIKKKYENKCIIIDRQDGTGKGDAIRKGFNLASKDILMILDADLTVSPEDLPKFYKAICENKGELIIGSRLVYPMENKAMRFFNILGNKFFALSFSFILNQPIKDTLCGTKVIGRKDYIKISNNRYYFGDFDPFGDFDLIFGSARMGLKIVELPVSYKARVYGDTNIQRWKHGIMLLKMLIFSARKIKFK